MGIQKLVSAELEVRDLAQALEFDTGVFGMREVARDRDLVYLSLLAEETFQLALAAGGTGVRSFAFSVDSEEDLGYYAGRLANLGIATEVRRDAMPGRKVALGFSLPGGHEMELVVNKHRGGYRTPATPGLPVRSGVAPADIDHITLAAPDSRTLWSTLEVLRDGLGFKTSDVIETGDKDAVGAWTRAGELHHDLGLLRGRAADTLHHLAWTMEGFDHLKTSADRLANAGLELETGPGRHGVGGNLYAYFWTPGGNRYELSAEMPRLAGERDEPYVRSTSQFNAFSAWGAARPESFQKGS